MKTKYWILLLLAATVLAASGCAAMQKQFGGKPACNRPGNHN